MAIGGFIRTIFVKPIFGIFFVIAFLGLGIVSVGNVLPATREGVASRVIAANPERVRETILDVDSQPTWRPRVTAVTRTSDDAWRETTSDGEMITFFRLLSEEDSIRLEFESTRGYRGDWWGLLSPTMDGGAMVYVVERATIPSPASRILSWLFFDPGALAAAYLEELAREVARREDVGA